MSPLPRLGHNLGTKPKTQKQKGKTMNTDPLDTIVDDVDLSYPIIPAGIHEFRITKAEKKTSTKGSEMLVLTLVATTAKQSVKGELIQNFTLTHNLVISPSEKVLLVDIGKRIATVAMACGLRGITARDIINNPQQLVNRVADVKTSVSQERTDPESGRIYEPRSEVHSFVVKK